MPKPEDFHYIGQEEGEPIDEARHFYRCPQCGQAVDKRDLGEVAHHEVRGHLPIPHLDPPTIGAKPRRH